LNYIIIGISFVVIIVFQNSVLPFFSFGTIKPDLLSILVMIVGVKYGKLFGMTNGFILGLVFDLFTGGTIGLSSFTKTLNGFVAGYWSQSDQNEERLPFYKLLLVLLLCVTMDNFLYNFISGTGLQINFFELVLTASILPGIYSLVLSLPILFFRERLAI
jgi:rod shape-determining protein MreD